eukprot:scaffold120392_cov18-Tisochrysis_lutea.AAC.1
MEDTGRGKGGRRQLGLAAKREKLRKLRPVRMRSPSRARAGLLSVRSPFLWERINLRPVGIRSPRRAHA